MKPRSLTNTIAMRTITKVRRDKVHPCYLAFLDADDRVVMTSKSDDLFDCDGMLFNTDTVR